MENMLEYKGKPLVRSGNTLYYGNPAESCVAMLKILSTKDDAEKPPTGCWCRSSPPMRPCPPRIE